MQEKDHYSAIITMVGFLPERNNRYAYFLSSTGTQSNRSTAVETTTTASGDTGVQVDSFKYATGPIAFAAPACSATGTIGVFTGARGEAWTGLAMGQIDGDPTLDVWSISTDSRTYPATVDRTCSQGVNVPGGEPANDVNDVNF
jgi:type IV pilus assembly protein PilA